MQQSRLEPVTDFLKRGGKIQRISGFTAKPLPAHKPPKKRKLKVRRKPTLDMEPSENQVRIDFIAQGAGYASNTSLRNNKKIAALMPKPLRQRAPGGGLLYDKTEALEAIERIKELRKGFWPEVKDVDAALHKYASYAKKQRNKRELRKEWTV